MANDNVDDVPSVEVVEDTSIASVCVHKTRVLSEDEKQKLAKDVHLVSEFKQRKLELEARKNWDLFYKRNSTNFFKDRHWTIREFEELANLDRRVDKSCSSARKVLLEVGCGVGNFIFPLIEEKLNVFIHACDFSARAVQFVKENPLYDPEVCNVFQCDVTSDDLSENIEKESVDFCSLIFVLSAIHPDKMLSAVRNIHKVLRIGGVVLVRDYGVYDHAMLRFAPGRKLMENFYVRQDGTRAYYFSKETMRELFVEGGFHEEDNSYVFKKTVNMKEGIDVDRVFLQAKFRKT